MPAGSRTRNSSRSVGDAEPSLPSLHSSEHSSDAARAVESGPSALPSCPQPAADCTEPLEPGWPHYGDPSVGLLAQPSCATRRMWLHFDSRARHYETGGAREDISPRMPASSSRHAQLHRRTVHRRAGRWPHTVATACARAHPTGSAHSRMRSGASLERLLQIVRGRITRPPIRLCVRRRIGDAAKKACRPPRSGFQTAQAHCAHRKLHGCTRGRPGREQAAVHARTRAHVGWCGQARGSRGR